MKLQSLPVLAAAVAAVLATGSFAHAAVIPSLGAAKNFAILGLDGGSLEVNNGTNLTGNVGFSSNVAIPNAQKVSNFNGTTYVYSNVLSAFNTKSDGSLNPVQSGPSVDALLNQANADALAASTAFTNLATTQTFGALTNDQTVVSNGNLNVIAVSSVNYNNDTLTLQSRPGQDDFFVFNITGDFAFAQSTIALTGGTTADHVIFNFPDASNITINKGTTIFNGTVLAPDGTLRYHNPASFDGALIAENIEVDSGFNLIMTPLVPEPASLSLLGLGAVSLFLRRRRKA